MERADKDLAFMTQYENIAWFEDGKVRILDRRVYPVKVEYVVCETHQEVAQAITDMVTQSGGPYLAASMGMALAAFEAKDMPEKKLIKYLEGAAHTISHARPTTAAKMKAIVEGSIVAVKKAIDSGDDIVEAAFNFAVEGINKRYLNVMKSAKHLVDQFPKNGTIMTQCFASTILPMMLRECKIRGNNIKLITPETRPYFQGAKLTASVIHDMGFDVTLITDNMPAFTMQQKKVDVFTCAADVITLDGYIVNKVGTLQIAIAAQYWGIPFFVSGTPNIDHPTISSVKIEERASNLVLEALGQRTAMQGVKAYYPAFDITPPKLCNGVATNKGMMSPFTLNEYYKVMDECTISGLV